VPTTPSGEKNEEHWYPRFVPDSEGNTPLIPSPTTFGPRPNLSRWHARLAADYAVLNPDGIRDPDLLRVRAARQAAIVAAAAAALGKLCHRAMESEIKTRGGDPADIPADDDPLDLPIWYADDDERADLAPLLANLPPTSDEVGTLIAPFLAGFRRFRRDWHPVFMTTETTCQYLPGDPSVEYGGQLDTILGFERAIPAITGRGEIPGKLHAGAWQVGDLKTGKEPRDGHPQQICAYSMCDWIDLRDGTGEIHAMPEIDGGVIIHGPADGRPWSLHPVLLTDELRGAVLASRRAFNERSTSAQALRRGVTVTGGSMDLSCLPGFNEPIRFALAMEGVATIAELAAYGRGRFADLKASYEDAKVGPKTLEKADAYLAVEDRTWADAAPATSTPTAPTVEEAA
jgi:hypothetical protein